MSHNDFWREFWIEKKDNYENETITNTISYEHRIYTKIQEPILVSNNLIQFKPIKFDLITFKPLL